MVGFSQTQGIDLKRKSKKRAPKQKDWTGLALTLLALAVVFALFLRRCTPSEPVGPTATSVRLDHSNGWKLLVNGKPFLIRGACYHPIPVGQDHSFNFWDDPNKPWITDGQMMQAMGVNTIRIYQPGRNPAEVKAVLGDLHSKNHIYTLMGHHLGFWDWPPPNYAELEFREKIKDDVLDMVRTYKDEPGILMWVLGNENNYSFDLNIQSWTTDEIDALPDDASQRKEMARIYYTYVNDLAREIKKIDPSRLVVIGMGEVKSIESFAQYAPDVDVIGMIAYRGNSFGNLFSYVKSRVDKPVVMIEWGADNWNAEKQKTDDKHQADFIEKQWLDIEKQADPARGAGNSLGGTIFEWTDEWWKSAETLPATWSVHDTTGSWASPSYFYDANVDGQQNMNEEWWGVVALNPEKKTDGLDTRVPKRAYHMLQYLWTGRRDASLDVRDEKKAKGLKATVTAPETETKKIRGAKPTLQ